MQVTFVSKGKAEYYEKHTIMAQVNSPAKIAMWSVIVLLGAAIVGAQFVKVKK